MVEGMQFTCPVCGFTVITPKGEEDLMKHVDMHAMDFHSDMPMTHDQIRSMTKVVAMPPMQKSMM